MSQQLPETDDLRQLFLNDIPMLDVRAPVEFTQGAFPCAHNVPLMNDTERHRTGIRYKEAGQAAAIELGHQLVNGDVKAERVERWLAFARANPDGCLYCFRGGLRSQIAQQWLQEAGISYPRITGGYKAMRRFLLDELERLCPQLPLIVVSGRTGTGKTRLLKRLPNPVDLEGLAEHRGSSFGRKLRPQPSQIDFENALAVDLLKASQAPGPIHVEDESHLIGRRALPQTLQTRMAEAPLMILEQPMATRVQFILEDYVIDMSRSYRERDGEGPGFEAFREFLLGSLRRIRKRLGGLRHQQLEAIMVDALDAQQQNGNLDGHRQWIEILLREYYDPMYDHQLEQKKGRILVRDSFDDLLNWSCRNVAAARA